MAEDRLNRFGKHQKLHSGVWRMDRLGLLTGIVELHEQEETQAGISFTLLNTRNAPTSVDGVTIIVPCVNVERRHEVGKGGIYTYAYEGAAADFEFADDNITFELDFSMAQEPIEAHPDFPAIKAKFGWNKLRRQFAEFMPGNGTTAATGFGGAKDSKKKKNPLYGTDSYLEIGAIFRKTRLLHSIPASALRGLGAIVTTPPGLGQFPMETGSNRNWLKLVPKISRRGNVVQISEEWMLSGPRGWSNDIYGRARLEREE